MPPTITSKHNPKLAVCFVLFAVLSAIFTSMTYTAREYLKSGRAIPVIEMANDYFKEGNLKYRMNEHEAAMLAYQDALRIYPEYAFVWTNLGSLFYDMGSMDAAIAAYSESIKLMPTRAKTHFQLGKALQYIDALNDAISCYLRAIQLNSRFVNAYYKLGTAYRDNGSIKSALESFQSVLHIDPLHVPSRLQYCHILHVKENLKAAESCYNDVLSIEPNTADALIYLGDLYRDQNDFDAALKYYAFALDVDPRSVPARYMSSAITGGTVPRDLAIAYTQQFYNTHAYHYESTVLHQQKYNLHKQLQQEVTNFMSLQDCLSSCGDSTGGCLLDNSMDTCIDLHVVDLGCGTGLLCEAFRDDVSTNHATMIGVDLSSRMLNTAKQRSCYSEIYFSEASAFLKDIAGNAFDVAVGADIFSYTTDLQTVFEGVHSALKPDGVFIFSIYSVDSAAKLMPTPRVGFYNRSRYSSTRRDTEYIVLPTGIVAHSILYISQLANSKFAPFVLEKLINATWIQTKDKETPTGHVVVLRAVKDPI